MLDVCPALRKPWMFVVAWPGFAGTRIPVWVLVQAHRLGMKDAEILKNYPSLTAEELEHAWVYAKSHQAEIEEQIRSNENA